MSKFTFATKNQEKNCTITSLMCDTLTQTTYRDGNSRGGNHSGDTRHRGKYHCVAGLQFYWFGLYQARKYVCM